MSSKEIEITEWFARQSQLCGGDFPIGIGDDMAQVRFGGEASVFITCDMLLEGVHFDLGQASIEQAGYKAMAVSLSDCAAMATVPVCAVVSVGLPSGFGSEELKKLHSGIVKAGDAFGCALAGGDITKWAEESSKFVISVAMMSRCGGNRPVRRSGAKAGDSICVTGSLGGAGQGKHLRFVPRVKEALKIAAMVGLNSMIDISDGLSTDMGHICRLSGVGAIVDAEKVPISEAAGKSRDPLEAALNDGEDFELLFTLSEKDCERLISEWDMELAVTKIGVITEGGGVKIKMEGGEVCELKAGGYDHLAGGQ